DGDSHGTGALEMGQGPGGSTAGRLRRDFNRLEQLAHRRRPALLRAERRRAAVHVAGRPQIDAVVRFVATQVAETVAVREELARTLLAQCGLILGFGRSHERGLAADRALVVQEIEVPCTRDALDLGNDVPGLHRRAETDARQRAGAAVIDVQPAGRRAVVATERTARVRDQPHTAVRSRARLAVRYARIVQVLVAGAGERHPRAACGHELPERATHATRLRRRA